MISSRVPAPVASAVPARHPPGPSIVVSAKVRMPRVAAIPRERLLTVLDEAWRHRLCLVVGPAGCGKTTLLAQFAAACGAPVLWCRVECSDADPGVLLAHLEAAARGVLEIRPGPWQTVADAANALEGAVPERLLIAVDDLHTLHGSPAERALGQLLEYLPAGVAVVAGTRRRPSLNLSRLRVADALLEVGPDALRFRLWEVDRLFREQYGEPLGPEELADLSRRTEGWAAVLHLFHLATRGRGGRERRRMMAALSTRMPLVREYLIHNVLDDMGEGTRRFLLGSSVLARLSGAVCDELLGRQGSDAVLADLERLQLVSPGGEDEGWFRCHEVLRSHLATILEEEEGEVRVREERRRAGAILEAAGADADALAAYCAAEDWCAAGRLLGLRREQMAGDPGWWVDYLPAAILDDDPWVMLAAARRHRAAGRCRSAIALYRRAEAVSGTASPADACRRERAWVTAWLEPLPLQPAGWQEQLRLATQSDPLGVARRAAVEDEGGALVGGLAALIGGEIADARRRLGAVLDRAEASSGVRACARLGHAVACALGGDGGAARRLDAALQAAEREGFGWLARRARDALLLVRDGWGDGAREPDGGEDGGWGAALGGLLDGWAGASRRPGDPARLGETRRSLEDLRAPVLACWAAAQEALAQARLGDPGAHAAALRAERSSRRLGAPGPLSVALLALAELGEEGQGEAAAALADRCGLVLPGLPGRRGVDPPASVPGRAPRPGAGIRITCFGGLALTARGRPLDLGAMRPKVRSLLRLVLLHGDRPVHREVLIDALWPETDLETGTRNLQVAVSSLRQALDRGAGPRVVREGGAYRLDLARVDSVDLLLFDAALATAASASAAGEGAAARSALRRALALYTDEVFPEEGPADWVVPERDRRRAAAVDAALMLATSHCGAEEWGEAIRGCERALAIDPECDRAWSLLIRLHERAGGVAAAARARRRYAEIVADLHPPA